MATGDTHVADQLDTVHHKIGSEVHGYHVYKSVWSPVIREQLILEKETYPCIHFLLDTNPWTEPPRGGGATGAICPGPHSARGPILSNVTSIMQKCFQP